MNDNYNIYGKYGCWWEGGTGVSPDGHQCGECYPNYEDKCPFLEKYRQIEEMAKDVWKASCAGQGIECTKCKYANNSTDEYSCVDFVISQNLYNAGYRKQGWISVEDRLPEELFTAVLIYCPDNNNIYCAYLNTRNEWHIFDQGSGMWVLERVTHWMPLPEPPKGGAE